MPLDERDAASLWDILKAAKNAMEFIQGIDKAGFSADKKTHYAVIAQLEIIGEATKRLSPEFRQSNADIPWRKMAGMRDILIHVYDEINLDIVWLTVNESLPSIVARLDDLLNK